MRCWTCGTEYQGHACPVCSIKREIEKGADRIADAQRDAAETQRRDAEALREALAAQAEEQSWRMEAAAVQATRDQRQNIADSFRLQSAANNKRASELLSAGLLDEALHHAEQAIHLDQGNLDAHLTAGGILWRQNKLESALTRFGKAVNLLRTVDYQDRADWFLAVLRRLPTQADLYGEFVSALQQTASSWKHAAQAPEAIELIFALDKARLHSASVGLTETVISCAPRLQLFACLFAVSRATSAGNEARLRTFLDQYKDNRAALVDQVRALRSAEVLPTSVSDEVMRFVQSTYRAWGPYIEEQVAPLCQR
jgi:tetratricopeptide (TPR) repeat protein